MSDAQDFVGKHVFLPGGKLWSSRSSRTPYIVVGSAIGTGGEVYLRGLCYAAGAFGESNIKLSPSMVAKPAKWADLIAMTRDPHWPAWISKEVFDEVS